MTRQAIFLLALLYLARLGVTVRAADATISWAGRFQELPVTAIRPEGWLRQYLVAQRDGLTGHLENAGYPFTTTGWAGGRIPAAENHGVEEWWPYEQNAYWVDGMLRCGLLLQDDFLLAKARRSTGYVLEHPAPNGYLGPRLADDTAEIGRWIHVVFFRALMADADAMGGRRISDAMRRHFLADRHDYGSGREVAAIEAMLWTFGRTGDPALLRLAEKTYRDFNARAGTWAMSAAALRTDVPANGEHGVTFNEIAKLGAILFLHTGTRDYLESSVAAFRKLEKYHLLISGVNVSSEQLGPVSTIEAAENCDISDYTWSLGYLLMATGEASYADRIERAAFNAAPGSVTADFKALQYYSAPNQVVCTHASSPKTGGAQMAFAPNPGTECCPGNVSRMMPDFAARTWMRTADGGLAAVLYAPSQVAAVVGTAGAAVEIHETTAYPFSEEVRLTIRTTVPTRFPLSLRIPGWCRGAAIAVNNRRVELAARPGTFACLEREFADGDVVLLTLPQQVTMEAGPDGTVSIVRGPLVYALKIDELWKIDHDDPRSTPEFPAWDVYPKAPWNYALALDRARFVEQIALVHRAITDAPWSAATAPIELHVPARRVAHWSIDPQTEIQTEHWDILRDPQTGKVREWRKKGFDRQTGFYLFTPAVPDPATVARSVEGPVVTVTLVPYGCARLRIAYFPLCPVRP